MNDPGKTHSIYDGLTLRQVIALHQQALGELADAYGYASRLFHLMAPQCELLPDLLGILTQIDNAAAGRGARIRELEIQREEGIAAILRADADIHQLQTKCEKILGLMALAGQAAAIVQIQLSGWVGRAEAAEKELAAWRDAGNARNPHAQLAALVAEIWGIAAESILPDGDGVDTPVALWAESVLERFSALAAEHDLALRADSYEAGQAAEKAAQQATYWADQKMPMEPTFNDGETP